MNILLYTPKEFEEWRAALCAQLPEARVHAWPGAPACDYAVLWKPPAALFVEQARLKAIFSLGAGVNSLLALPGFPAETPLVRMEDSGMAAQMEEYALYCALRQFRRFGEYARAQAAARWAPQGLRRRQDFNIGVLGLGVLGARVARALGDFGFAVTGWSRTTKDLPGIRCRHGEDGLDAVLASSQLLILLLPLTRDTAGLLNRQRLARMPAGAALVNLARGELVVETELLPLLDAEHLDHAYLDVFATEPLPPEHRFWNHARISITPHIAALTPYAEAAAQVAGKIRALERGESISGVVDRRLGY